MGKSSSRQSNKPKGNIVERIVAMMHESPGVEITSPAYLPGRGTNRKKKREIDVLLTGYISSYQIRLAIECKNEKKPIGSPKIDAFIGKLQDVGIPTQQGIYVSASGYTQDAIEVARQAGLKVFTLEGLSKDALESALHQAIQNVIFLQGSVINWTITNTVPTASNHAELMMLCNKDDKPVASIQ